MSRGASGADASRHDHCGTPHQALWVAHRRRRRQLQLRRRHRDRLPRPERRRQVDHPADADRLDPAHVRRDVHRRPHLPRPAQPRPAGRIDARRRRPAPGPYRPRDAQAGGCCHPGSVQPDRRDARTGRPDGCRQASRRPVLAGHAPAAGHRAGPDRRPARPDPRRAGERPRPRGNPLDARPGARLRRSRGNSAAVEPPAHRGAGDGRPAGRDRQRPDHRRRRPERPAAHLRGRRPSPRLNRPDVGTRRRRARRALHRRGCLHRGRRPRDRRPGRSRCRAGRHRAARRRRRRARRALLLTHLGRHAQPVNVNARSAA